MGHALGREIEMGVISKLGSASVLAIQLVSDGDASHRVHRDKRIDIDAVGWDCLWIASKMQNVVQISWMKTRC